MNDCLGLRDMKEYQQTMNKYLMTTEHRNTTFGCQNENEYECLLTT